MGNKYFYFKITDPEDLDIAGKSISNAFDRSLNLYTDEGRKAVTCPLY